MEFRTHSRRSVVIGTASALAVTALPQVIAAQSSTPAEGATLAAADGQFPVTIEHIYGETTIEKQPVRVVTWGWESQDAVIALGIIPVAMPSNEWGGDSEMILPWTRTALGDNPLPIVLDTVEVPFEAIAAAKPDLILATYSGISKDEYNTLSKIAPTVAYPETAWGTASQDVQTITGAALGKVTAAEKLIADTEALIASQTDLFPQLAGKTFVYGNMGAENSFDIYTVTDARSQFLTEIGLEPSAYVKALKSTDAATTYFVPESYELANEIEGDIVVFWFDSQESLDQAMALPALQAIPAGKRGSFAPIVGKAYVMASSAFSVLSIPHMLDEFIPTLAAAADKV